MCDLRGFWVVGSVTDDGEGSIAQGMDGALPSVLPGMMVQSPVAFLTLWSREWQPKKGWIF
jgi:hypothetical protein